LYCRFEIMGFPQTLAENINQIAIAARVSLSHLNSLRHIPRSIWQYADILQKEGKTQEALKIAKPWKIYLKQITKDSDTLIGILVAIAIAQLGEKEIPKVYRKAGEIKLAKKAKCELAGIASVKEKWKADIKQYEITKKHLEKAGIFVGLFLPVLGKIDFAEEEFATSRKIEYIAVEKAGVILLNAFFLIAMIGCGLTAIYWRIRSKQKALLLTPPLRLVGNVFLLGIILPLTVYVLISILGIVGGHEYNIASNAIALGAQFIILLTLIPAVIFILIRKHINQRCLELDIVCPEIKKSKARRVIVIISFLFFAILAMSPLRYSPLSLLVSPSSFTLPLKIIGLIAAAILVSYVIILFIKYFTTIFSGKQYALYYGALAKTLVPIFALAMIFMTLIVIPYLEWREADLISKDKVIYGQSRSFTHAEDQVTQRLKAAMLKAME
ncbi:MAG: hypothetical protein KOO69_03535, partial [Victivallales bacterium]|nr:hypothetical protein [Victivallales bacterium]